MKDNFSFPVPEFSRWPEVTAFPKVDVKNWRNGLAVRMPNHLGDAIMAIPALSRLKEVLPEYCGLFVIAPFYQRKLYCTLPFVDDTVLLGAPHRLWSFCELKELRCLRPGAAILFNHSFRDALMLKIAGVPGLYGEPSRSRGKLLDCSFSFPPRCPGDVNGSHQVQRYLAIADAFGDLPPWNGVWPEIRLPYPEDELTHDVREVACRKNLLLLAAGASYGAAKRWPGRNFAGVAEYWIGRGGVVAVLGSQQEREIGREICTGLPDDSALNLCGKTDIYSLIVLFRHALFTVANDSGLMHLAAAVGAPGAAIFGPTDFTDTAPMSVKWRILRQVPDCAPCLKHVCPKKTSECMHNITPEKVISFLPEI